MLEAVPNVSEGRSAPAIEAVGEAFASAARVLDVHSDPDHHRSVYTLAGEGDALVDALIAGAARAVELIDLRVHEGVHPRIGAVDVVPVVPLRSDELARAGEVALAAARRLGDELGLTVFLYAELGGGLRPAYFRRGGPPELARRVAAGEVEPDFGPRTIDARSGAVLVGARRPLVAYNVELATADVDVARTVASVVRESGGGMLGVQALGLLLPRSGRVQVSMNVLDLERSPLHAVVTRVAREASLRGVEVAGGELVGLVPRSVLEAAREAGVDVPGVDDSRTLEHALGL